MVSSITPILVLVTVGLTQAYYYPYPSYYPSYYPYSYPQTSGEYSQRSASYPKTADYSAAYRPVSYSHTNLYEYGQSSKYPTMNGYVNQFRSTYPSLQLKHLQSLQAKRKQEVAKLQKLLQLEKKLKAIARREYDDSMVQLLLRILESSRGAHPAVPREHLQQLRMTMLEFLFPRTEFAKEMIVNGTETTTKKLVVGLVKDAPEEGTTTTVPPTTTAGLSTTVDQTVSSASSVEPSATPLPLVAAAAPGKDAEGAQLFSNLMNGTGRSLS